MKQGKVYYLWQLICSETPQKILIPQIQRDYVQYRSGRVEENLERFVSSLVNALVNNSEINLNFVYGNVERIFDIDSKTSYNAFCPIDGQQRLTTLYLLHYYVLNEADEREKMTQLKGKLVYRTRKTTMDFITALFEKNAIKFSKSNKKPSELISESGWYTSLWDADPSILSCLKVLDVFHDKLSDFDSPKLLAERLTSDTCPITFMKLELEQLDNPNELYIKMNSRGRQLTAFENFKSEMFRIVKDKVKFDTLPNDFKAKIDGDWLELIWNMCGESYTDIFYRDLIHTCFMNSLISLLTNNPKDYINKLDSYMKRSASSFYIEDYVKCFNKCNDSELPEAEILLNLITRFYYTMECLRTLSIHSKKIYEEVTSKIFETKFDEKKGNHTSNLENYHDNYIPHTLLQAICVFANSNAAKSETKAAEFIAKFEDWWRITNNLITNTEIDDIHSFISAIQELHFIKYSYFIAKYFDVLKDNDSEYISLDSSLKSSQKKEEILKQKIINLGDKDWTYAIRHAEEDTYFNGEINFALKLTGIVKRTDTYGIGAAVFSGNWSIIEEIFKAAKEDNILMHRVLLTFGDYSQRISDRGADYLLTFYSYSEKHHNQDWRGLLRDGKFDIFESLFNDYKANKNKYKDFMEYARDTIKKFVNSCKVHDLNYYLVANPNLFEYTKAFRCWVYDKEYRLLETSVRSDYVNYELYQISKDNSIGSKTALYNGSGTKTKCYLSYNGKEYVIKEDSLYERNTTTPIASSVDSMINLLPTL